VTRAWLGALVVAECFVTAPAAASNDDAIAACVAASTSGQRAQRSGALRSAQSSLLTCARAGCPAEVRSLCERLLTTVEASLPTVVLGARDASGQDLVDVEVSLDGAAFAEALDGKALAVDPGPHTLRFVRRDGTAMTLSIVAREAEKNRQLTVSFPVPARPTTPAPAPDTPAPSRRPPVLALVLAGVGVASIGAFASLALDGQRRYDRCNPAACSGSTVDGLALERGFAFGALGLGVVALGAAAFFFFHRGHDQAATAQAHLPP
jgi:hypothetical protein